MLIFELLSAEAIGKLYQYQLEHHGLKLLDPREPVKAVVVTGEVESTDEIERLMAQPRSRGE